MNNIKNYPESVPLELNVKDNLFRAYAFTRPPCADLVFNTLFGWASYFGYKVSRFENFIFVHCKTSEKLSVLLPLETEKLEVGGWGQRFLRLAEMLSCRCKEEGVLLEFTGIPESYAVKLPEGRFGVSLERDHFDYVYKRQDLAELNGRAYAQKRNLIKQFENRYNYSYEPLGKGNVHEFEAFIRSWEVTKAGDGILGSGAYCMACRLIESFGALELFGGLIRVEGKPVAATIASIEQRFDYGGGTHPTAVVHHENALTHYKGAYQIINREFAKDLPKNVIYVNREEDLGIEGLRKAKMSYNPEMLINKATVKLME